MTFFSGRTPLFSRLVPCCAAAAALLVTGCDRAQEDRAADAASQAVRQANQALNKAAEVAREGLGEARELTEKAGGAAKDGAHEAGRALADGALTARVKTALLADESVPGARIDVDSSGGTVTLSGRVDDPGQIERAVALARSIEGVAHVDNRLRVEGSS